MIVRTGIRPTKKFVENEKAFNREGFFYNESFVCFNFYNPPKSWFRRNIAGRLCN